MKDARDANGFKMPIEIVLEPDVSPKHRRKERNLRSFQSFQYNLDSQLFYSPINSLSQLKISSSSVMIFLEIFAYIMLMQPLTQ